MSVTEINRSFDHSLRGIRGHVIVGGREYEWKSWENEILANRLISVDTETELITAGRTPQVAVIQAFDGRTCYLIHPDQLAAFIRTHAHCKFVMHNAAFDWHVIYRHLLRNRKRKTARSWLRVLDQDRVTDTMILDQLVRIAQGSSSPVPRNLARLAEYWSKIHELDKEDPWRLRYSEILDADWRTVPRDAWTYAARDAIATRHVFFPLRNAARDLVERHGIEADVREQYGPLTARVQVQAAVALAQIELNGICIDQQRQQESAEHLQAELEQLISRLETTEEFRGVFRRDPYGSLIRTSAGAPAKSQKRLREVLRKVAAEHDISPPETAGGELSLSKDFWRQHTDTAPFIEIWQRLEKKAKMLQFFKHLQAPKIHPRYSALVRTGRTSCNGPNIQQMPRTGNFREIFIPRPGNVFLIIDYAALELRTLAAVCEQRFGYSVLGDTIRAGRDPHCYTAALIEEMSYADFMELKATKPERFKLRRQAAKAVNFGVPGGLGAESLSHYANISYGVNLSPDDAQDFRERFLADIYPEIGDYMARHDACVLAENLKCKARDVREKFRSDPAIGALKRIVRGTPHKRDGTCYAESYVRRAWADLCEINRNEALRRELELEQGSLELERRLLCGTTLAPAGFIRGQTTYCQSRNTPFQSCAATGAKIALWNLFRAGYRVIAFVHDEFVIELPDNGEFDKAAARIDMICCKSMQEVTGTVPIECEYAVARCWSKAAELVQDERGRLAVWEPA